MSGRTVSTLTNVKDVNKLADHVTNENDIITDQKGQVYLKHGSNSYLKLALSNDNDSLKSEITKLKSENTKLKNRVSELETSNKDILERLEALEQNSEETDPEQPTE